MDCFDFFLYIICPLFPPLFLYHPTHLPHLLPKWGTSIKIKNLTHYIYCYFLWIPGHVRLKKSVQ